MSKKLPHAYIVAGPFFEGEEFSVDKAREKPIWKFGYTSDPPHPCGRSGLAAEGLRGIAYLRTQEAYEHRVHDSLDEEGFERYVPGSKERRKAKKRLFDWADRLVAHGIATRDHNKVHQLPEFDYKYWHIANQEIWRNPRSETGERGFYRRYSSADKLPQSTPGDFFGTPTALLDIVLRPSLDGAIECDPCTSYEHQQRIQAERLWLTYEHEGSSWPYPWGDNVWCFPPYYKPAGENFARRFLHEHQEGHMKQGIICYHLSHQSNRWFAPLWRNASAYVIPQGRIKFIAGQGMVKKANKEGSASDGNVFLYFGDKPKKFIRHFKEHPNGVNLSDYR